MSPRPAAGPRGSCRSSVRLLAVAACLIALPSLADVTGTVTITGKPNSKDESFYARSSGCGESPNRTTENWKIGPKGELADVVVWVTDPKFSHDIAGLKQLPPEVEIKQMGCRYVPHVTAVQAGVPFKITNCDPALHNVHAKVSNGPTQPPGEDVFNFGQGRQGQSDERSLAKPGLYTLQCEVHSWMQCWVYVLPHSVYAVTGPEGTFKLQLSGELADGDYQLNAWHPKFVQPLVQTIHVKDGKATAAFQFDGAKSL